MKAILTISLLFWMSAAQASVWESTQSWNDNWDQKFSQFIKSNQFNRDIFRSSNTILHNIPTDCADMLYAVRIYFAYKHKLPFVIHAPSNYHLEGNIISNLSPKFDHIENERERVRAFIRYITLQVGAWDLASDTYPVKVVSIKSGDIYVTEWSFFGSRHRHSMYVKSMGHDGNGLFYWSDAPREVQKLSVYKKVPKFSFKSKPWGYRRWRRPEHMDFSVDQLPTELEASDEQYRLLNQVGHRKVLKAIRDRIKNHFLK